MRLKPGQRLEFEEPFPYDHPEHGKVKITHVYTIEGDVLFNEDLDDDEDIT